MLHKKLKTKYAPTLYKPVLRCSICTGEQVAGFRELKSGKFIEIMLINSPADLARFKAEYEVDELVKEY